MTNHKISDNFYPNETFFSEKSFFLFFFFPFLILSCVHVEKMPESSPERLSVKRTGEKGDGLNPAFMADSHFHLRNYIQEGLTLDRAYEILSGQGIKRAAVFGIPLQQRWDMETGVSPGYYLHDDQSLYYYSAVDAIVASEYQSLPEAKREIFDPMIVGFNPTDGRAVDHIRNMLLRFPGTFTGIGEFSVKKEVVSGKIAGGAANLEDPALGRILNFAGEVGLVVILHCDIDAMISNNGNEPTYLKSLEKLFIKHRGTKIIWAHTGLGRYVKASLKRMGEQPFFHWTQAPRPWTRSGLLPSLTGLPLENTKVKRL